MDESERLELLARISNSLDVLTNLTYLRRTKAIESDEAAGYLERLAKEVQQLHEVINLHVRFEIPADDRQKPN